MVRSCLVAWFKHNPTPLPWRITVTATCCWHRNPSETYGCTTIYVLRHTFMVHMVTWWNILKYRWHGLLKSSTLKTEIHLCCMINTMAADDPAIAQYGLNTATYNINHKYSRNIPVPIPGRLQIFIVFLSTGTQMCLCTPVGHFGSLIFISMTS